MDVIDAVNARLAAVSNEEGQSANDRRDLFRNLKVVTSVDNADGSEVL